MKDSYKKVFALSALLVWLALPVMASAADPEPPKNTAENINVELKIPLPFVSLNCAATNARGEKVAAVCNLSDYLRGVYKLLIGTGALLAVVMMIIAGYQWMIAGGSADQAGAAKKRVWGASMGLALALVSYIVLNAISSRLVDLRLPQIKPVQPFALGLNNFCQSPHEPPDRLNPLIVLAQNSPKPDQFLTPADGGPAVSLEQAECNKKYLAGDKQGQCMGGLCPDGKNCIPVGGNRYECQRSPMYGTIDWNRTATEKGNGYVDDLKLVPVCGNELDAPIAWATPNAKRAYKLALNINPGPASSAPGSVHIGTGAIIGEFKIDKYKTNCEQRGEVFNGFVLKVQVNNDCWWSPTIDTEFAMGNDRTTPIHQGSVYNPNDIDWSQTEAKASLLQISNWEDQALQYDLVINRSNFPVILRPGMPPPENNCPVQ